eukprot:TRINITY_DN14467_c0_g1_i2.p1 TRINITY_DN14467_c0_g1~~TRINITY_DN14467_c0_g1_i2.p1  ORF type:complete len:236 (-),score=49.52 TRINITY_DN14467_c0_g1_i2:188-895(-)
MIRHLPVLVLAFIASTAAAGSEHGHDCVGYKMGQKIKMQCKNSTNPNDWGPGPICQETGEEMYFLYGVDSFHYCGWDIQTADVYEHLRRLILRDENWACRIGMAPEHDFFIPFNIPVWGVVESDHMHIDNHLNFVFHADAGKIIGAAAYPVRDRFQFAKTGSVLTMHGPIKWFNKQSFMDFTSSSALPTSSGTCVGWLAVVMWCLLSAAVSLGLSGVVYRRYLKPKLIRGVLKTD